MSDLCPVAVAQDSVQDEYQPESAVESHLLLLKQKKYCDVTFTFPNLPDRIEAHEFCLKARSPVFAKIFRMRKSGNVHSNEIEISESTPERFQQFLEFVYADKLEVNIVGALELMQLSQKYKVHPLTKKCEELLKTDIPIVDSYKIFATARRYGRRDLMDRAGPIMTKLFIELARTGTLSNAEEQALFQVILDWGRNQVGYDGPRKKNKLKNLIPKIRYTNMAPDEFTKVVLPTGLLTDKETISVYSYLCGDEIKFIDNAVLSSGELKTEFNTTRRKVENVLTVTKDVGFCGYFLERERRIRFPAFSKHYMSFHVDRTQVDGKVQPDYSLRKTVITGITFGWPIVNSKHSGHHVLNFNVSVVEYSGPAKEGNFTIRFQKKLLNHEACFCYETLSVKPPVQLVPGRTYSVIVEDHSTSDSIDSFRKDPNAYDIWWNCSINREANVDFEDGSLTLRDIDRKTDFYSQKFSDESKLFALIYNIEIGLL